MNEHDEQGNIMLINPAKFLMSVFLLLLAGKIFGVLFWPWILVCAPIILSVIITFIMSLKEILFLGIKNSFTAMKNLSKAR